MIIDFHTHAFPDGIAARTIDSLASAAAYTALTDGTVSDLRSRLDAAEVDLGVILPVATKPAQFESITRFALENCEKNGILSFGSVHPDDEKATEHIRELALLGLSGIKLHPDFQGAYIDDERYVRIVSAALDAGLTVVTHAGVDEGFHDVDVRCTPERAARLLDRIHAGNDRIPLVLAHGGGLLMHREVMKHLVGRKIYFDLSMMLSKSCAKEVTELIKAHGSDGILLGSDCPWGDPALTVEFIRSLPLTNKEKSLILGENAAKLLKIEVKNETH